MTGRPLLLIDGYNVLSLDGGYRDLLEGDADAARARLVDQVAGYAAGSYDARIVFDGTRNPRADGTPHEVAGVTVVFSPYGVEADSVLESSVHEARRAGRPVVLVTSDAATRDTTAGEGVTLRTAAAFVQDLRGEADDRADRAGAPGRSTVEERLTPDIREALMRWARGQQY